VKTILLVLAAALCMALAPAQDAARDAVRFGYIDAFVDAGGTPLAAYQLELSAPRDRVKIVGIEGGEHTAFKEPPYYDPAAMEHERVVIGAFCLGEELPHGAARVARVHVQVTGEGGIEWETKLVAAATAERERGA
jgi:hypothetical protein